jgi:preprotein translocase subunit Sec61beta
MQRRVNSNRGGESIFIGDNEVGVKIDPKTVLALSLLFIGCVVVLHFIDKIKFS